MATRKSPHQQLIQPKEWQSAKEIQKALSKLRRRIAEVESLNALDILNNIGAVDVVVSDVRTTIFELFGENSPEYQEHRHITMWYGSNTWV